MRVARRIDVGMVGIIQYWRSTIGLPLGGTKGSGYGREHCMDMLSEFTTAIVRRVLSGLGKIPVWRRASRYLGRSNIIQ